MAEPTYPLVCLAMMREDQRHHHGRAARAVRLTANATRATRRVVMYECGGRAKPVYFAMERCRHRADPNHDESPLPAETVATMTEDVDREEAIRALMREQRLSERFARFVYAVEQGELAGDMVYMRDGKILPGGPPLPRRSDRATMRQEPVPVT